MTIDIRMLVWHSVYKEEPVQKTKPVRTTLYLPPDLWKQCKIEAIKRDCDATDIVVEALRRYLGATGRSKEFNAKMKRFDAAVAKSVRRKS